MTLHEPRVVTRLRPKRSLGQNFLRDANIARKIVASVNAGPDDTIVEIGPGEGALTTHLARVAGRLIVVELDDRIVERLYTMFPSGAIEIRRGDILATDLSAIAGGTLLRVVGNIPYNITSPILFHLLDHRACVRDATIMMQREVARRLAAQPGTKEYGILSVGCQFYADVALLFDVAPGAFRPAPRVTSTVVRLTMRRASLYAALDEEFFRRMVRSVFGKRRKTLRNSLRYFFEDGVSLPAEIDKELMRRPEDLSIHELVTLSNTLLMLGSRVRKNQDR